MINDKQKELFLIELVRDYYNQGDFYYARKNKKNKWHFGYDNDYSMQHGCGENFILPDDMVLILMSKLRFKERI